MPLVALAPPGGSNDLDRYELLFRFAAGGMAEVFVARQRGEGGFLRPVAIKRMLPALAEEPKFVEMFLDEARLAALVQSPHVVPTLDCGKDEEGSPYIVMELVVGLSLSQALRGAAEKHVHVPPAIVAEVIAQTALGLYDAHHARTPTGQPLGIVHRDVSPQNVLIGVDGRARLTDFGVARALERVSRTSTGEVKGKLSYFSPEQAKMEPLDQRSDLFALGVVAWEMLTLERLFSRESPMAALQAVLYERIPDVRELNPDVPEKLALAVAHALERDLDARCPTGRVFAEELRAAVGASASPTEIGAWIEEAGGPRLAKFKGRIERAFGHACETEERALADQSSRTSLVPGGSGSQQGLFHPPTESSQVVGPLGPVPEPTQVEHTPTRVATPLGVKAGAVAIAPTRDAAVPGEAPRALEIPIDLADAPAPPSPSRATSYVVAAGVAVGLAAAGIVGAVVFGGPSEAAPLASPTPPVVVPPAPSPSEPSTPAATRAIPVALDPPTSATAPPTHPRGPQGHSSRTGEGASTRTEAQPRPEPSRAEPSRPEPSRPEPEATRPEPEAVRLTSEPSRAEPEATRSEPQADETPERGGRLRVGTGAGRLRGVGGTP